MLARTTRVKTWGNERNGFPLREAAPLLFRLLVWMYDFEAYLSRSFGGRPPFGCWLRLVRTYGLHGLDGLYGRNGRAAAPHAALLL